MLFLELKRVELIKLKEILWLSLLKLALKRSTKHHIQRTRLLEVALQLITANSNFKCKKVVIPKASSEVRQICLFLILFRWKVVRNQWLKVLEGKGLQEILDWIQRDMEKACRRVQDKLIRQWILARKRIFLHIEEIAKVKL